MKDLHQLRAELDELDRELLALMEKRVDISREIGAYKRAHALPILDVQREKEMLLSRAKMLKKEENQRWLRAFMLLLFRISRSEQRRAQNVYLIGPSGGDIARIARALGESTKMNVLYVGERVANEAGAECCTLIDAAQTGTSIVGVSEDILADAENLPVLRSSGRVVYLKKAGVSSAYEKALEAAADITLDADDSETLQILWDYCIE